MDRLLALKEHLSSKNDVQTSKIRILDIGKNHFRFINPMKKKNITILLDSYLNQLKTEETPSFDEALNFYFENRIKNQDIDKLIIQDIQIDQNILWHIYCLVVLDRLSSMYARFEYLEYQKIISHLNERKIYDRNKVKYVITSHPTQPNSMEQIVAQSAILQALEQNDMNFMSQAMKKLIAAYTNCKFVKPTYVQESITYHRVCIPNMIQALSMAYELGLENIEDFYEIPGTWVCFDFDNHPEMSLGIMSLTNGNIKYLYNSFVQQ